MIVFGEGPIALQRSAQLIGFGGAGGGGGRSLCEAVSKFMLPTPLYESDLAMF